MELNCLEKTDKIIIFECPQIKFLVCSSVTLISFCSNRQRVLKGFTTYTKVMFKLFIVKTKSIKAMKIKIKNLYKI